MSISVNCWYKYNVAELTYHPELGGWQKVLQTGRPGGRTLVADDAPSSSTNTAEGKPAHRTEQRFMNKDRICFSINFSTPPR